MALKIYGGGVVGSDVTATNTNGANQTGILPAFQISDPATGNALGTAAAPLVVSAGGSGTTADQIQGNVASGATDSGNPVKVGGLATSNGLLGPVTAGQRVNAAHTTFGQVSVAFSVRMAGADGMTNSELAAITTTDGTTTARLLVAGQTFNGVTWDRTRKVNLYKRVPSSAASGNPDFLKASAGDVMQFWGLCGATAAYLQLYNKASAPTIGSDTPVLTFPLLANAAFSQTIPNGGAYFGTGIAFAFTTDAAGATGSAAAAITSFALLGA